MLLQHGSDAFSRYNALLHELGSFENALDRRTGKHRKYKSETVHVNSAFGHSKFQRFVLRPPTSGFVFLFSAFITSSFRLN